MPTRCALIGMPGAGKSTAGRQVARRLQLPFIDMDQLLEERLGCRIRDYFEQHGEAAFRAHEAALLAELADAPGPMLLSPGGGIVLREDNRAALRRGFAPVLYLRASPDELFRRLRHDRSRPLLQTPDPLARLRELYRVRDPLYREVASHVIETGRPTLQSLVGMVLMQLELAPGAAAP
ncbi:shikimate kinase [Melaminivora alkalimesophila]|uniref:Shikimate kinase n=1 Tax=Melaminivora alkalimesophila TaxID=1165852 RepID=A0A317RCP4_9BURK|nr:shikimate kinase [Melaminivora alkalimesophila]PWW47009.1 shikimate kinase [Melaminivora alkalimesophila]